MFKRCMRILTIHRTQENSILSHTSVVIWKINHTFKAAIKMCTNDIKYKKHRFQCLKSFMPKPVDIVLSISKYISPFMNTKAKQKQEVAKFKM